MVGSTNTAEIDFATTADNTHGITVNSGGFFYSLDNPAYYGSVASTTLYANWTSGQSFQVAANVSSAWLNGMQMTVHKNTIYSSSTTDTILVTVNTVSWNGTYSTVTINETAPGVTFYTGGIVNLVSRNVILSKQAASTVMGNNNTNRPTFTMTNTTSAVNCLIGGVWTGWYELSISYNAPIRGVIRNGSSGIYLGTGYTISGNIYSNSNGISQGSGYTISGNIYSNSTGIYQGSGYTISGNIYSNSSGISQGSGYTISGNIYSNSTGIYCSSGTLTGRLGYNASGVSAPNTTTDFYYDAQSDFLISNPANFPSSPVYGGNNTNYGYPLANVRYQDYPSFGSYSKYANFGTVIKNTSTLRTGGAPSSIQVTPASQCSTVNYISVFDQVNGWVEDNVPATAQTRSVWIEGTGWSSFPTAGQLYLSATYYSGSSGAATTTVMSTAVLTSNSAWVNFPVTFTPGQVGKVVYQVYLGTYTSGASIYIGNALYRTGYAPINAIWANGESHMNIGQTTSSTGYVK
jgi:hypothetical protein